MKSVKLDLALNLYYPAKILLLYLQNLYNINNHTTQHF